MAALSPQSCNLIDRELLNIAVVITQVRQMWQVNGLDWINSQVAAIGQSAHTIRSELAYNTVHPRRYRDVRKPAASQSFTLEDLGL